MKDLIIQALNDAFARFEKTVPQTKTKTEYVDIEDVSPANIVSFMKEKNIPDNACFGGKPNGYDAFDQVCLCYDVKIPTTDKERLKYKREKFSNSAWAKVYPLLTQNGYKRVGFNTGLLKAFDDTTVYDMFINSDFDRLVKYYSLSFIKA